MRSKTVISAAIILAGLMAIAGMVAFIFLPALLSYPIRKPMFLYGFYLGLLNLPIAIAWRLWTKGSRHAVIAFWFAVIAAAFAVAFLPGFVLLTMRM